MGDTLLYLVHGADVYVDEAIYSLLTAFAHVPPDDGSIRYVVYSDRPEAFAPLGVETVAVDATTRQRWLAGDDYIHRLKMCAHRDALDRFGGRVVFVDTDTYFRRSPQRLFARIGPGRSVLHIREGRLSEVGTQDFARISSVTRGHRLLNPDGSAIDLGPDEVMWNSGVTGLHVTDAGLLDAAIGMVDQLRRIPAARAINQIEQFATGAQLARHTQISESVDTVFHYWFHDVKAEFRSRLPQLLADCRHEDVRAWGRRALADHPVTSRMRRLKMHVRTLARRARLRVPGPRASA